MRAFALPLATPLLADDYLRLVNPLWSARELRGRILEVRPETQDSVTVVIKPGWGYRFEHRPGQYIGIGLLIDGRWRWRSYSLTSPADCARTLTITVKAMPEGVVSGHLVGGVRPGTVVRLASPRGDFVLPDPPPPSVLFLTAGSGVTPVVSMLRTMKRRNQIGVRSDIVHVHSAPTRADALFAEELQELGRGCPGYRLRLRATRAEGRLEIARIGDEVPDWQQRETWVCGPRAMLDEVEQHWAAAGLDHRLHVERFAATRAATGAGGTVTFARTGRSRVVDAATSLLEAGEQAGVGMPSGCRMGICHTCVVSLVDGHVRDLRTGTRHEPGSRVQACVAAPEGDCVVDV